MMADINARIESTIRSFTAELQQLIGAAVRAHVESALGSFGAPTKAAPAKVARVAAPAATPAAKAPAAKAVKSRKKGAKRTAAELARAEKDLLEYVTAKPGQRMEEISAALGAVTKDLSRPLQKLLDTAAIRREGVKRASRYYPTSGGGTVTAAAAAPAANDAGKGKKKGRPAKKAGAPKARAKKG